MIAATGKSFNFCMLGGSILKCKYFEQKYCGLSPIHTVLMISLKRVFETPALLLQVPLPAFFFLLTLSYQPKVGAC